MAKKLSNISYMPAVENVSRKFALRRETCTNKTIQAQNSNGNGKAVFIPGRTYMGAMTIESHVNGYGIVKKNVLFIRKPMTLGPASAAQADAKTAFMIGNEWAIATMKDLSVLTQNQQTYLSCRDNHTAIYRVLTDGYQSMYGWVRAIAIKAANDGVTLPQSHLLTDIHE